MSGDSETEEKLLEPTNVINKNDSIEEGKEEEDEEHAPETEPLLEIIEEPQTIPSDRKPSIDSIKVSTDPKTLSKNASPITTDPHVQDLVSTECDLKKMRKLHRSKSQNVDDKYAQSIESDDITKSQEDEHYKELTQQPDDFEIGMATGLLPGCVAPAPTPAPSIG